MSDADLLEAMTYANDFQEFIQKRDEGRRCLIDKGMFYYFLEVLPPRFMGREVELVDGSKRMAAFGFAEGAERITAFWEDGGHFFAQHTKLISSGGYPR
jgi:hypothetical protein